MPRRIAATSHCTLAASTEPLSAALVTRHPVARLAIVLPVVRTNTSPS